MALELKNYDPALMQGANIGVAVDLTDITDNNGNEVIEIDGIASAVNYLAVGNSATANPVILASRGDDTNVGLTIDGKGSGTIVFAGTSTGGITLTTAVTASAGVAITGAVSATTTIKSSGATSGIGYGAGAGGAVTQLTSRTTGVTLNNITGTITTNNASLAAEATADFIVTNSAVAIGDVIVLSMQSGSNGGGTLVNISTVAAGSFTIRVHNGNVAAGTAETGAILINFAVIKAVSA